MKIKKLNSTKETYSIAVPYKKLYFDTILREDGLLNLKFYYEIDKSEIPSYITPTNKLTIHTTKVNVAEIHRYEEEPGVLTFDDKTLSFNPIVESDDELKLKGEFVVEGLKPYQWHEDDPELDNWFYGNSFYFDQLRFTVNIFINGWRNNDEGHSMSVIGSFIAPEDWGQYAIFGNERYYIVE